MFSYSHICLYVQIRLRFREESPVPKLGGGFKDFVHPYLEKISDLTKYFSDGLKPPTKSCQTMAVFFSC